MLRKRKKVDHQKNKSRTCIISWQIKEQGFKWYTFCFMKNSLPLPYFSHFPIKEWKPLGSHLRTNTGEPHFWKSSTWGTWLSGWVWGQYTWLDFNPRSCCLLLAEWPWASYLNSLCLSFLICKNWAGNNGIKKVKWLGHCHTQLISDISWVWFQR